jgi:hypothetical protein
MRTCQAASGFILMTLDRLCGPVDRLNVRYDPLLAAFSAASAAGPSDIKLHHVICRIIMDYLCSLGAHDCPNSDLNDFKLMNFTLCSGLC